MNRGYIQPGHINIVPIKSLPVSLMDMAIKVSGIFHFYKPTLPGAGFVSNPVRPTATTLLSKSGVIQRV